MKAIQQRLMDMAQHRKLKTDSQLGENAREVLKRMVSESQLIKVGNCYLPAEVKKCQIC